MALSADNSIPMSGALVTDAYSEFERRIYNDRRKRTTSPIFIGRHRGRRFQERRSGELVNKYVDRYEPELFLITIGITILSCFDAFFTLQLLHQGKAVEINPVMLHFIEMGVYPFIIAKVTITSSCLLFLVAHKNFYISKIPVSKIIHTFFIGYTLLVIYEITLLFII